MSARTVIEQYVSGWKEGSSEKILATLTPDCFIRESHGPVYRGHATIHNWLEDWNTAGNRVTRWDIISFYQLNGTVAFEWEFTCWAERRNHHFLGATIAKIKDSKISELHEYRMISKTPKN
jgi:hypothetical protein